MYQGNWQCSGCGGTITELPFEPKSEKGLTCRACFMKQKDAAGAGAGDAAEAGAAAAYDDRNDAPPFDPMAAPGAEPVPAPPTFAAAAPKSTERQTFTGEWSCSVCGGAITSLPFEPRSTANLKCIDCFKQGKA
jgi:CxxC-x17-CxxC domain-containing protein